VCLLLGVPQLVQLRAGVPLSLGFVPLLALRQPPVPGEPGRARVRVQRPLLGGAGVKSETVRLDHLHGESPVIAATARAARSAAARCPYRRAHRDVRISVTSRIRSSSTSDGSATSSRRPCAASAASTYSAPNRANPSRCSVTI